MNLGRRPRSSRGASHKLRKLGAVTPPLRHRGIFVVFDPEAVKLSLDDLCAEAGVDVLLHGFVSDARREADRIRSLTFRDHGGAHILEAAAFVDATGDCDLAFLAGASTRYGNHGRSISARLHTVRWHRAECDDHARSLRSRDHQRESAWREASEQTTSVLARLAFPVIFAAISRPRINDPRDGRSLSRAEAHGRKQAGLS